MLKKVNYVIGLFTTDDDKTVRRKISRGFTGGAVSVKEQKKLGGNPSICSIYQYYYYLFEPDVRRVKNIYERYRTGDLLCGECKAQLADKVVKFLTDHRAKREKARDKLEKFMIRD